MASLDSLPADQRAVLQLVLQRGRTYDEIAAMLSIDRAAVRERALQGLDALGPATKTPAPQRALLTDYLLGQLPPKVAEQTHDRLWNSPGERAWARVVAAELAPLSPNPLPDIPVGRPQSPAEPEPEPEPVGAAAAVAAAHPARSDEYQQYADAPPEPEPAKIPLDYGLDAPGGAGPRKTSSRRGGAILLGLVALVVLVVVIIALTTGGSSPKQAASTPPATTPTTPTTATTGTTGTTATTTTQAHLVAQINLTSPTGAKNTAGVAQVIQQGTNTGIVIVAQGVPANTPHNAYAVWLYKSASQSHLLGFVSQRVKSDGKLQTAGVLPANASQYSQLLLTVETQPKPTAPGTIVLQGRLALSG
jgi:hypothetical protein